MVFSSLIFLYGFFSLSLLGYGLCRTQKRQNTVLLIFSLIFYAWGEPKYVLLLMFMAFVSWFFALREEKSQGAARKLWLIAAAVIEPEYLAQLNCSRQDAMLAYLHDNMSDNVLKVDTVSRLVEHNDEYIYYRTDHHWTALGAYYAYTALCDAAGMEDFVKKYDIDDVIVMPYLIATQATDGNSFFKNQFRDQ